jgi:L-malate glycosyltransferase
MKNILWLTEWLPTELEPFAGDGIERRAKAASLYNDIFIIYVKKNPALPFGKVKTENRKYNDHCTALIYYYPSIKKFSRLLDVFLSNYYFLRLHARALRQYKKNKGKPAGIQVNVTMKNGIIALLYKRLWHIKYIVVEGWSLFLPEEKPQFKDKNWLFRFFTLHVLKNSSLLITVSDHLGKMINRQVLPMSYEVIPSVIDKTIFYPVDMIARHNAFRFIHISNLARPKNIEQILLALQKVISEGHAVELVMHIPSNQHLLDKIRLLNLEKNITIKQEVSQARLADSIRNSDALILFSLYETFGNVIIEAQGCGIPVITSDYPVFRETINDYENGIMAKGKDASSLAQAMVFCIENKANFDAAQIAKDAHQSYSFERIGGMLNQVYEKFF